MSSELTERGSDAGPTVRTAADLLGFDGGRTEPVDLDLDRKLELMTERRRRDAIDFFGEHDEGDIGAVTDFVAGREVDGEASGEPRKRVYVSLYQSHLPRLVEYGVVEKGPDGTYTPGPRYPEVRAFKDRVEDANAACGVVAGLRNTLRAALSSG